MLNLALTGFLACFLIAGFQRPFLWVLVYLYVDIVQPQLITWGFLSHVPVSLLTFVAAFGGWLVMDDKRDSRFTFRQGLLVLLLAYCAISTWFAVYHDAAMEKWDWVWKALIFSIFLPLTLRTRLRIEAVVLTMVLAASALIVDGGLKTVGGGGGYGELRIFIESNTGLFEGSILSCVAVAIIPLILWLARHGSIMPKSPLVWVYAGALIFACALIPVGTAARTGLVCLGVLCIMSLRTARHKVPIAAGMAVALLVAVPFLPRSYVARMDTIEDHQADQSASTRLGVWKWTWNYVKDHPLGGGFEVYLASKVSYDTVAADTTGSITTMEYRKVVETGRAFHSSYFEMLGEQGYPGFAIWMTIQALGLLQMEMIRRRWAVPRGPDPGGSRLRGLRQAGSERGESVHPDSRAVDANRTAGDDHAWVAPLATALQLAQIVYLVGSVFVGIAFQPFILMLIGIQCGLWSYLRRIGTVSAVLRARGAHDPVNADPAFTCVTTPALAPGDPPKG